jgi:hypothetical protein
VVVSTTTAAREHAGRADPPAPGTLQQPVDGRSVQGQQAAAGAVAATARTARAVRDGGPGTG